MRFSVVLITLALLPLAMILHGWIFTEKQLPHLRAHAMAALQENGIRAAVADLRYLDLRVAGNAADLASLEKARAALALLGPVRLVADELGIPANLRARLEGGTLFLEGWLPEADNIRQVQQLLRKLRPDLDLQTGGLKQDAQVRWPEGEKGPLTVDSQLLGPIIEKLRVAPWLEINSDSEEVAAKGILPANGLKAALMAHFPKVKMEELLESTHTLPADFSDPALLLPLVTRFFQGASPRRFSINDEGEPLLEAAATRTLESEWLALLRPVTGGKKVVLNLTFYPSEFHLPDYRPQSPLQANQVKILQEALAGQYIPFSSGSATLTPEQQARLAALTPLLLTAGPAARFVIGGHAAAGASSSQDQALALARAEQVHAFLIEQGLPASDVKTMAFDSVPAGTAGAPAQIDSVEILLR